MSKTIDSIIEEWGKIKKPFYKYTTAQTLLNDTIIAIDNGGNILSATEDAAKNLPFFATINLVYAKGVDYITRKLGRYGRLGANIFSLSVTGGFYLYAALTNDNDPTIPSAIAGTIGIYFTNQQVTDIQKGATYNYDNQTSKSAGF